MNDDFENDPDIQDPHRRLREAIGRRMEKGDDPFDDDENGEVETERERIAREADAGKKPVNRTRHETAIDWTFRMAIWAIVGGVVILLVWANLTQGEGDYDDRYDAPHVK